MFRDLAAAVRGGGKEGSRLGSKLMLCGGGGGGAEVIEPVYLPGLFTACWPRVTRSSNTPSYS